MLKDLFNYFWLVNETDDPPFESPQGGECALRLAQGPEFDRRVEPHLALALGTGKGVGLIDLSDEVGPALSAIRSVSTV